MADGNDMSRLLRLLGLVQTRLRRRRAWRGAAAGWLAGSLAALVVAAGKLLAFRWPAIVPIALPILGLVGGLVPGLVRRSTFQEAARVLDTRYGLKQRAATALAFLQLPERSTLHELQIKDAIEHLQRVDLVAVVPLSTPRVAPYAGAASGLVVLLLLVPSRALPRSAGPVSPFPAAVVEGQRLEAAMLLPLEQLGTRCQDDKLAGTVARLRRLTRQLQQPGIDQRETLAGLSEMQATLVDSLAEYDLDAVDVALKDLGESIACVDALRGAAEALEKEDYRRAAAEFDSLDPASVNPSQGKIAAARLKRLVKSLGAAGQGHLAEAVFGLRQFLKSSDAPASARGKKAGSELAGICRAHATRKTIGQQLLGQLECLDESKARASQPWGGGPAQFSSTCTDARDFSAETTGPPGVAPPGIIASQRQQEAVSGLPGDGPAQRELAESIPHRQAASRSYRELYQQYRKMSEAVLESEPLPPGYRESIRRYFELIRPQDQDAKSNRSPVNK